MAVCHALSGLDVMNRTQRRRARLPPGSPVGSLSLPSSPGPRDQHAPRGQQVRPAWGARGRTQMRQVRARAWLGRREPLGVRTMAGKSVLQASGAGVSVRAACHQHLSWSRWGGSQGGLPAASVTRTWHRHNTTNFIAPQEAILPALPTLQQDQRRGALEAQNIST